MLLCRWPFCNVSDHFTGQYGVVKGKALPYETDVKIPFVLFGPGVPPNATYVCVCVCV